MLLKMEDWASIYLRMRKWMAKCHSVEGTYPKTLNDTVEASLEFGYRLLVCILTPPLTQPGMTRAALMEVPEIFDNPRQMILHRD
jgi:hypothetical protein